MIVHLPQHLVTQFVGGVLCTTFAFVVVVLFGAMEQTRGRGYGTVWEAVFGACLVFGAFYGVGWLALRYL